MGRHEEIATKRGVAVYALNEISSDVVLLLKSEYSERMWFLLHSQLSPILVCAWYRRPDSGKILSITSLRQEYMKFKEDVIGTIIIGDLNVHA